MKEALRFGILAVAVALAFGQAPAHAQDNAAATTNTPAAETVGPRELENFELNGTVTRPAEPAPATTTAPPPATRPATTTTSEPRPAATGAAPARTTTRVPQQGERTPAVQAQSVTANASATDTPAPAPGLSQAASPFAPLPATPLPPSTTPAPSRWPWLVAALALVAAGLYFFRRQRSRSALAFAGGPEPELAPPEPTPQRAAPALRRSTPPEPARGPVAPPKVAIPPAAAPSPEPTPEPSLGIVTTSLRPWLDFQFEPTRCTIEDGRATIEFNLIVTNNGGGPARDVLVEANMFNAGQEQDKEVAAFFSSPIGKGERTAVIPPQRRLAFSSAVTLSGDQIRPVDIGGRQLFVPLVGFNALYRWGGGEGQTSLSYLVGREGSGDKLAPFRLDQGPKQFARLGARANPLRVRK